MTWETPPLKRHLGHITPPHLVIGSNDYCGDTQTGFLWVTIPLRGDGRSSESGQCRGELVAHKQLVGEQFRGRMWNVRKVSYELPLQNGKRNWRTASSNSQEPLLCQPCPAQGYLLQTATITAGNQWSCHSTALPSVTGADAGSNGNPKTPRPWETRTLSKTGGKFSLLFCFVLSCHSERRAHSLRGTSPKKCCAVF